MENQLKWRAKMALACYSALVGGILLASIIVAVVLFIMGLDYLKLPFPLALIAVPVTETTILGITLLFARHRGASLKELGVKKVSFKIVGIVSVVAVLLFLLGLAISAGEEIVLGQDPMEKAYYESVAPRDFFQLSASIALSLFLVGPCEELAFRGFVQKGLENSFGKMKGLLVAAVLFGLLHGLNTPRAIVPISAGGLVLGYVWQRTGGNTIASALTHGINNSIAFSIAYFLAP